MWIVENGDMYACMYNVYVWELTRIYNNSPNRIINIIGKAKNWWNHKLNYWSAKGQRNSEWEAGTVSVKLHELYACHY